MSAPPGPGRRSRAAGSVELERRVEGSEGAGSVLSYNPHMNLTLTQQRQRLPIFKVDHTHLPSFLTSLLPFSYHTHTHAHTHTRTLTIPHLVVSVISYECVCSTAAKCFTWWRSTEQWLSLERLALGRLRRYENDVY